MDTFNRAVNSAKGAFSDGDKTTQSGTEPVSGQTGTGTIDEPYDAGNTAGQTGSTGENYTSSGTNSTLQSGNLSSIAGDTTGNHYGSGLSNTTESVHYDDRAGEFVTSSGDISGQSVITDNAQHDSTSSATGNQYDTGLGHSSTTGNAKYDGKTGATGSEYGTSTPSGTGEHYQNLDQSNRVPNQTSSAGNVLIDSKIGASGDGYGNEAQSGTVTGPSGSMSNTELNTTNDTIGTGTGTGTTDTSGPTGGVQVPSGNAEQTEQDSSPSDPATDENTETKHSSNKDPIAAGGDSSEAKEHRAKGETWTGAHWIKFPGTGEGAEAERRMEAGGDVGSEPKEASAGGTLDPANSSTHPQHKAGMVGKLEGKLHMGGHHTA